ncbi:hypothetical protein [Pseudoalteromonas phage J2-1]|uniref:AP2/ERF domain-containing protein n=1 Tax=Pseudoalteromonas phage J2-1 TaxID=2023998 RepID=A0A223LH65_9CAUD|nr:HNH endonuclease [Pseudoalteromonas phage J2-1]ASU03315.1 hypothetical protein [Pseudoalteromonas phage J2-1]
MRKLPYVDKTMIENCLEWDNTLSRFLWKFRKDKPPNWNGRFAGKLAGYIKKEGYETITIDYVPHYTHRLVWVLFYGDIPEGYIIDHIDRNRSNNSSENLRLVTNQENCFNTKGSKGTSKYKGVHLTSRGKWAAQITCNGKTHHLGVFEHEEDAKDSYNCAAKKYFKEKAYINI